jgi:hypothetical protein
MQTATRFMGSRPVTTSIKLRLLFVLIAATRTPGEAQDSASSSNPVVGYFQNWFERVSKTQAEQPHWVTPLATVTPRLEQELRYDQFWQALPGGHTLVNYGGGKGLELIPAEPLEVIIGMPAYETQSGSAPKNGWADETFLLKYRILSANEENGNYILTAFFGLSVPTGSGDYTADHYMFTPTIAFGKGWGRFDFQSTLGVAVPDNGGEPTGAGTPILFNTALQYHVDKWFWPEVEANYTYWPNGKHDGLNQLFITPGVILGRFPILSRVGCTVGVGCQFAVTDNALMHRNVILSGRIPF